MNAEGRTRLRLALRDLASGAAFASIASSGSVPLWAIAAYGVGLALSLSGRRVLARAVGGSAIGLGVAAVVLFASAFRGHVDLVVAACSFAALVTVHRMLSPPAPSTDNQVHLTSLLMITGGAALSGELVFGACLAAFGILGCLSLALAVLDTGPGDPDEVSVGPLLRGVAAGALVALLGGALFFAIFPRLSWNLAARRTAPGLGSAVSGFSDRVRLGGGGSLKTNPRAVLRAAISPDPGTDRLDAYWVGRTFDTFDGVDWTGRGVARAASPSVQLRRRARGSVFQKIELLPAYGSRTLVALEPPVLLGNALALSQAGSTRTNLVEVENEEVHFSDAALAYSYQASSLVAGAAARSSQPIPDLVALLALPETLDPRVRLLAIRVVGPERDPLRAALALRSYLRSEYRYTLELPGDVADPLSDFLFVRKEGHCEHFATALAVLLRAAGFPARVAAGFYGGKRVGDQYVVRAGDAHAWTQVYVPSSGFVTVDATPDDERSGQPAPLWGLLASAYEELDALWRSKVLDYSFQDQAELARSFIRPPRSVDRPNSTLPPVKVWVAAAAGALVVYAIWRTRKGWVKAPRHPVASFADAIDGELTAARAPRRQAELLEEAAVRLRRARHPLAPALTKATTRYLEARFGSRPLGPGEREALLASLRRARKAGAAR